MKYFPYVGCWVHLTALQMHTLFSEHTLGKSSILNFQVHRTSFLNAPGLSGCSSCRSFSSDHSPMKVTPVQVQLNIWTLNQNVRLSDLDVFCCQPLSTEGMGSYELCFQMVTASEPRPRLIKVLGPRYQCAGTCRFLPLQTLLRTLERVSLYALWNSSSSSPLLPWKGG